MMDEFLEKITRKDILIRYATVTLYALLIGGIIYSWDNCSVFQASHVNRFFRNFIDILRPEWPLTVLILFLVFFSTFKSEIKDFIRRIEGLSKDGVLLKQQQDTKPERDVSRLENRDSKSQHITANANATETDLLNDPAVQKNIRRVEDIINTRYGAEVSQKKVEGLLFELAVENLNRYFEQKYRYIFGSQIQLLNELLQNDGKINITEYFSRVKSSYPDVFKDSNVEDYIRFLIQSEFLEYAHQTGLYKVSDLGKLFLLWLHKTGYADNKTL